MHCLRVLTLFVLFGTNALFTLSTAQVASGLDTETGLRAFRSYDSGPIDTVNLSSGKLQVNIPVISYPQRGGKLKLDYELIYSNSGMYIPGCLPTATSSGQCAVVWPLQGGFFLVETSRPGGSAGCGQQIITNVFGSQVKVYTCGASLAEADGAPHPLSATGPATFRALDGSGYRIDLAPGSVVSNSQHVAGITTDRNGTKYYEPFSDSPGNGFVYAEDTNGNQILASGSELTDTLGRVIPPLVGTFPDSLPGPFPAGLGTTDFSGCVGPLPTVGATLWNPPGIGGGIYPLKFCFALVSEVNPGGFIEFESCGPNAGCQQVDITVPPLPTTAIQLQSVLMPNGSTWIFQYTTDGFGNLSQVTLPTGGTISYTWTAMDLDGPAMVNSLPPMTKIKPQGVATRTLNTNDGTSVPEQWSYNYVRGTVTPGGIINGTFTTTVTDPGQNDTVHTFGIADAQSDIFETLTQSYNGSAANGQLLRTVRTDYKSFFMQTPYIQSNAGTYQTLLPIRTTTTLDNGLQTKQEHDWDGGFLVSQSLYDSNLVPQPCPSTPTPPSTQAPCSGGAPYGVTVAARDYDFGSGSPGPLLRVTSTPKVAFDNSGYLSNNLIDLASSETVTDGGGNTAASATYGYDESALVSSGITTQHDPNPPNGAARGNLTSVTHLVTAPSNACNSASTTSITSTASWFDTGEVNQKTDALGHATTYSYSPTFAGAYVTQVCNALSQCVATNYDLNFGLKTRSTDLNNQVTTFAYDSLGRTTQIRAPTQIVNGSAIQGSTVFAYNDAPGSLSVQHTRQQDSGSFITDVQLFDGLGRPNGTRLADPQGDIFSNTAYDAFGRVALVTNPYRSPSDSTYGTTHTQYDALSRITQVVHPDGSTSLTSYAGRAAQFQDEGNGSSRTTRITQMDALGRLSSVCEVTNATQVNQDSPTTCGLDLAGNGFLTRYQYDTLGNLTGVQQGAIARSFTYDTASRLLSATNPESGTTCYQYDANGNVVARTRPAPNQSKPAVTVTTTYKYDPLNRLTDVSYSDQVTPSVSKHYDTTVEMGIPLNNTVGRISAEYVTSPAGQLISGHIYSYDPMGKVVNSSQCTPQSCPLTTLFSVTYGYDLLGKPLSFSNPQGTTFGYSYDAAGRLATLTSSLVGPTYPATLFSGAQYSPFGALSAVSLGTALTESFGYDNRGRVTTYSSAVQPTAAQLGNYVMGTSPLLARRAFQPSGRFLGRVRWDQDRLRHAIGSISIEAVRRRSRPDRGSLELTMSANPLISRTITVSYNSRQSVMSIATRLMRQINRGNIGLVATVTTEGTRAVVHLVAADNAVSRSRLSVLVKAPRGVPSIKATVSRPLRNTPFLLGLSTNPSVPNPIVEKTARRERP